MLKAISLSKIFAFFLFNLGFLFAVNKTSIAQAQVTSDNTTGTQVTNNGNVAEITGGETRGGNLFHSFQDFSVPTNNEAFFNNSNDIGNIFSRVTGGNISNIDGLIRANGSANLFLVNPAGIMFGQNARLSVGGSFYGSTADSILFEGGEFSAADTDTPPLLTINAPIGFNFRDNPGDISSDGASLRVNPEQTFALLGGNLNFDGGGIGGIGGNVELGGLTASGTVDINEDGSFSFPESIARGDISLANSARIFVAGEEGGTVNINAQNLSLSSGSNILTGIRVDSGSPQAQAGDVVIDLTGDLTMDNSQITNNNFGTGNAGNVMVNARNVSFTNGGEIISNNNGAGNIGDIVITATGDISFDGASFGLSGISNFFDEAATGDIGQINLTAQNLSLTDGGSITSIVAFNNNSGDIVLNIADTIGIDGVGSVTQIDGTVAELPSSVNSNVRSGDGNSGNIEINAQNLLLNNRGSISATNFGRGNSGDININVGSLAITERGGIDGGILGAGNGGNIDINAEDRVSVIGNAESLSFIAVDIAENATGQAGNIEINTPELILQDAFISSDVFGDGEGGNININAQERVSVVSNGEFSSFISANIIGDGEGGTINISASDSIELSNLSLIQADVFEGSTGNGGNLNIETGRLTLSDGSQISASTLGNGNAGNVNISADNSIAISGVGEFSRGGIFTNALIEDGNGGNIDITTRELTISDGAVIIAGNFSSLGASAPGTGEPGNINISADTLNLESEGRIEARTQAEMGTGANIDLQVADSIFLSGSSFISAEALGNANGGNLSIDTNFIVAFPDGNNDIIASAAQGQGGNIDITAESLLGIQQRSLNDFTNDINASSDFGLDGTISINTIDVTPFLGEVELPMAVVEPEQTVAQVCDLNRNIANNSLTISGRGGVPPAPDLPLTSTNIVDNDELDRAIDIPEPLETAKGYIQPARGIKVTPEGISLVAYRTDGKGDRIIEPRSSCGTKSD